MATPLFLLPVLLSFSILAPTVAAAADPADKCEAGRLKLAGKYAQCMLKAEAVGLLRGLPPATGKCFDKFDTKCAKVAAKFGADCPDFGDCTDYRDAAQCASNQLPLTCGTPPDTDDDGFVEDDCEPCDPLINPGAFDIPGNGIDDDCDGEVDEPFAPCDAGLALDDVDPLHGAFAIDLCEQTTVETGLWGILSAKYVRANGALIPAGPGLQVGLQSAFGTDATHGQPVIGSSLLALSSGHARSLGQTGECGSESCMTNFSGTPPPGFPQAPTGCATNSAIADDIALEVQVRVPTNASSFRIRQAFYAFDYSEYLCNALNDQYIALVDPPPPGSVNGNVATLAGGDPLTVNSSYLTICTGCPDGDAGLAGTGFNTWNDAGATPWLRTTAPVTPGSVVTLRFVIWDTGDQLFDSTVLLDGFEWSTEVPVAPEMTVE